MMMIAPVKPTKENYRDMPQQTFTEKFTPPAIRAMRPLQWSKNRLFDMRADLRVSIAFFTFSFAASAVYIINDIGDREHDRVHPAKRFRPIASGALSVPAAITTAVICGLLAITGSAAIALTAPPLSRDTFGSIVGSGVIFGAVIAGYVGMNLAYTYWLKHQVLWDVFVIAGGFVLRAFAGALAIPVPISPWFYLCTLFLALFLALGKRRSELILLDELAGKHRANLQDYNVLLLDQLMSIVVTSTLITYSLYTFQADATSHVLMVTIPFVIFGIFRYLYLIYVKHQGDRPDEIFLRDPQILASVLVCTIVIIAILYGIPLLKH
jgi:4-hydroxybenzoate polyprenyltransferase